MFDKILSGIKVFISERIPWFLIVKWDKLMCEWNFLEKNYELDNFSFFLIPIYKSKIEYILLLLYFLNKQ